MNNDECTLDIKSVLRLYGKLLVQRTLNDLFRGQNRKACETEDTFHV